MIVTGNVDELSPALHIRSAYKTKACLTAGLLFLEAEVEVKDIEIGRIRPYEDNPRHNDDAVGAVAESIRQFGWKQPIVVDKDGVIVAGHTRYKAAQKLGYETVPCVMADDLTEEQVRAYRLADNKTADLAEWDFGKLNRELANIAEIDMSTFGFGGEEGEVEIVERYTHETKIPQYKVRGEGVELEACINTAKAEELEAEIDAAEGVTEQEKKFLREAASRHYRFNYKNIAEYYAAAGKEMQRLMERSALVIIDYEDAMANGYVALCKGINEIFDDEENG